MSDDLVEDFLVSYQDLVYLDSEADAYNLKDDLKQIKRDLSVSVDECRHRESQL